MQKFFSLLSHGTHQHTKLHSFETQYLETSTRLELMSSVPRMNENNDNDHDEDYGRSQFLRWNGNNDVPPSMMGGGISMPQLEDIYQSAPCSLPNPGVVFRYVYDAAYYMNIVADRGYLAYCCARTAA
jgi:hypothetical protein